MPEEHNDYTTYHRAANLMPEIDPKPKPVNWPLADYSYQAPEWPKPPQKREENRIIIGSLIFFVVVIAILSVLTSLAPKDTTPQPFVPPTVSPAQLTQIIAEMPEKTQVTAGTKIGNQSAIGGTDSAFIATYGQPTNHVTTGSSPVLIFDNPNSSIDQLAIILIPGTHIVFSAITDPPLGRPWDAVMAVRVCIGFLPEDSKLNTPQAIHDGVYQTGYSSELANTVPAGMFRDAKSNPIKPGTFSVKYMYAASGESYVNLCAVQVGEMTTSL